MLRSVGETNQAEINMLAGVSLEERMVRIGPWGF
jgi:hypothetical protein